MTRGEGMFVGPAVVVDDKIEDPHSGMAPILSQIAGAGMPIIKRTDLPTRDEIQHWEGFSLIILDWELFPANEGAGELPAGVTLPAGLMESNDESVAEFIGWLLSDLYCPIFVLSSHGVDEIWSALSERLGGLGDALVRSRVLVKSKSDVGTDLFGELEGWVRGQPAVYVLKSWERGYEAAKRDLFSDFDVSSSSWPQVLWAASVADHVNPHFELAESISRNILHRLEPFIFDEDILSQAVEEGDQFTHVLRRVVHRRSVVDQGSLHGDVLMPGDFFYGSTLSEGLPQSIYINVTPACDLVPRKGTKASDVRMTLLRAALVPKSDLDSKTKMAKLLKKTEESTSQIIFVLRSDGRPYHIDFKDWSEETWGALGYRRQGRLLDPYITHLQQRFALHFHRQGLPRLPEQFYSPRS